MLSGFFIGFALALLLWFAAFLYLKSYVRRRTSPDYILALLQEEVRQLEADIDEKTEQDLQLLEEKINALREICTEAERRIAVYSRELEKRETENQVFSALNISPLLKKLDVTAPAKQPASAKPPASAEQLVSVKPPGSAKPPAPNIVVSQNPLSIKPPPMKDRIAELYKAGFNADLIAKRLGLNLGEVKVYFNLLEKPKD